MSIYIMTTDGPKLDGASPALLTALLNEYEGVLSQLGMPVRSLLVPGCPPAYAEARLAKRNLLLNDELAVWFGWQNGVARSADGRARGSLPGLIPSSIDEAVACFDETLISITHSIEGDDTNEVSATWGIGPGWLQLEYVAYGIAVECVELKDAPRVRVPSPYFQGERIAAAGQVVSLCTAVRSWLDSANAGAFTWIDEMGSWHVDQELLVDDKTHSFLG